MPCSSARLAANRANSLKSCGPRTPEGKARSRANALKHGLTGEGVVVHPDDVVEIARRTAALERELAPSGEMGRLLVRRISTHSVRMERSSRQEFAAVAENVRGAEAAFDDARLTEVEHLISWIGKEPATYVRRLMRSTEGIDLMIDRHQAIKADLDRPNYPPDYSHMELLENLMGRRAEDAPVSRVKELFKAIHGERTLLATGEGAGMSAAELVAWSCARLHEIIDGEIEALLEVRESIDTDLVDQSRAEAGERALFDPSKDAILARKYEAAAERGMYRALRELREVEAAATVEVEDEEADEAVASSFPAVRRGGPGPNGGRPADRSGPLTDRPATIEPDSARTARFSG